MDKREKGGTKKDWKGRKWEMEESGDMDTWKTNGMKKHMNKIKQHVSTDGTGNRNLVLN